MSKDKLIALAIATVTAISMEVSCVLYVTRDERRRRKSHKRDYIYHRNKIIEITDMGMQNLTKELIDELSAHISCMESSYRMWRF